jgi:hypothetical protein
MTKEEILKLAHQANLPPCHTTHPKALARFAALVAAAEREACAQLCDDIWQHDGTAMKCRDALRSKT